MTPRIDRRLAAIEARLAQSQNGLFFFTAVQNEAGDERYTSQASGRSYTAEEVLALAEEHPDAVLMLPVGHSSDTAFPGFDPDNETTEEEIALHNAYTGRILDIATETGMTIEEAAATTDDPELEALRDATDALRRRWEAQDERVQMYEERVRPWTAEMVRRLNRINGRDDTEE